jgi:hypothetical protein
MNSRTRHVQNKSPIRFYYKNKTKTKQGCDKKTTTTKCVLVHQVISLDYE